MPVIIVILGEGGSGGALAVGIGDRVLMMENAVYSVITPEGCAAILWKDAGQASRAAECLRLTAGDLKKFGIIDEIISEPNEWRVETEEEKGSSKDYEKISATLKKAILKHLKEVSGVDEKQMVANRFQKFRKMGEWVLRFRILDFGFNWNYELTRIRKLLFVLICRLVVAFFNRQFYVSKKVRMVYRRQTRPGARNLPLKTNRPNPTKLLNYSRPVLRTRPHVNHRCIRRHEARN